jgi:transcription-repair coupling factor (superfamily II helicase)
MAELSHIDEIETLEEELADRFGALPQEVIDLLYVVRIKNLCLQAGVSAISQEDGQLALLCEPLANMDRRMVQRRLGSGVRVGSRQVWLPLAEDDHWQPLLEHLLQMMAALPRVLADPGP